MACKLFYSASSIAVNMRVLSIAVLMALLASSAMAAPQLLSGGVTSTGSDTDSTYVFSVTYKGNASVSEISVIINDVSHPMQALDPQDTNLLDGKIYYYETKLESGVNTYSFKCEDANEAGNTSAVKMLLVKDVPVFQLTHLDVVFAVLMWVPFMVYFMWLARKMTRALERMDKREESKENKEETKKNS
jgi:flagellar basal body-associated protein FliL